MLRTCHLLNASNRINRPRGEIEPVISGAPVAEVLDNSTSRLEAQITPRPTIDFNQQISLGMPVDFGEFCDADHGCEGEAS